MCLYPTLVRNRKYTKNKKNGGIIPPITDPRTLYVSIGCQKCMECRKKKARDWQVRLLEDLKEHTNGKFITLTFSDEEITKLKDKCGKLQGYELDNEIATKATRLFLERWRKQFGKSLRHWFITELGHEGTENIHLHGIVWTNESLETVAKHWQYGWIWKGKEQGTKLINYVSERTVNYITKYVHKQDLDHREYNSKILTSPGIGSNYTLTNDSKKNKYRANETREYYRTRTGHKIAMPIYWRNKIYTEKERELLWLQKLDKEERWICGEKVDVSKNLDEYYKLLKYHRQRSINFGYQTNNINWNRKEYEKQQREIMMQTRLMRAKKRAEKKAKKEKTEQKEVILFEQTKIFDTNNTYIDRKVRSHWIPLSDNNFNFDQ